MYVETRTTAAEVLTDLYREVEILTNRVVNEVFTRQYHPTYITKTELRNVLQRAEGGFEVAMHVAGGFDEVPVALIEKMDRAREAAKKELNRKA